MDNIAVAMDVDRMLQDHGVECKGKFNEGQKSSVIMMHSSSLVW